MFFINIFPTFVKIVPRDFVVFHAILHIFLLTDLLLLNYENAVDSICYPDIQKINQAFLCV